MHGGQTKTAYQAIAVDRHGQRASHAGIGGRPLQPVDQITIDPPDRIDAQRIGPCPGARLAKPGEAGPDDDVLRASAEGGNRRAGIVVAGDDDLGGAGLRRGGHGDTLEHPAFGRAAADIGAQRREIARRIRL